MITIEYKLRIVDPPKDPNGQVSVASYSEKLPDIKAAERRAKEILQMDNVYQGVQFWTEDGTNAGYMS